MTRPQTLVWTRAVEDWDDDKSLIAPFIPAGIELLHLPCLSTVALPIVPPSGSFDVAVVLSPNTVQYALADQAMRGVLASLSQIYTHGMTTAERLRDAGLPAVHIPGVRTAAELATRLTTELKRGTRCLWPTAKAPSFDLQAACDARGIVVTRVDCYETETGAVQSDGTPLTQAAVDALVARLDGVVAFASPSAVAGFVDVFRPTDNRLQSALAAVVMGPTTAKAANASFQVVELAPSATITELATQSARTLVGRSSAG